LNFREMKIASPSSPSMPPLERNLRELPDVSASYVEDDVPAPARLLPVQGPLPQAAPVLVVPQFIPRPVARLPDVLPPLDQAAVHDPLEIALKLLVLSNNAGVDFTTRLAVVNHEAACDRKPKRIEALKKELKEEEEEYAKLKREVPYREQATVLHDLMRPAKKVKIVDGKLDAAHQKAQGGVPLVRTPNFITTLTLDGRVKRQRRDEAD
jgi:hypothetical protein